jgi:hypothetical protein
MALDYAARDYLSALVRKTKTDCHYWARYQPFLVPLLTSLLTGPEMAAVIAGFEAITIACAILEQIPDPRET